MLIQKINKLLRETLEPLSVSEIAEKTDATQSAVRRALKRLPSLSKFEGTVFVRGHIRKHETDKGFFVRGHVRNGATVQKHYRVGQDATFHVEPHIRQVQAYRIIG